MQISRGLMKASNQIKGFSACALKIQMYLPFLYISRISWPSVDLPAVGVQKAMTTQHKGNVNSSSTGFQSRAGSQGHYLWVIHRANADSLPSTLDLPSPRLRIGPSSCSIETCFKQPGVWFWSVFMSAYLQSRAVSGIHCGGPRGVGAEGRGNKEKSMRRQMGVTMRINQSVRSQWETGGAVRTITNQ